MDLKEIQALIKFVSTAGVDEVEINQKDFKLLIKKNPAQITTAQYTPVAVQAAPVAAAPVAAATAAPAVADRRWRAAGRNGLGVTLSEGSGRTARWCSR